MPRRLLKDNNYYKNENLQKQIRNTESTQQFMLNVTTRHETQQQTNEQACTICNI